MPELSKFRRFRRSALLATFSGLLVSACVCGQALSQAAIATGSATPAASFDFEHNRPPLVSLDGQWRFHPGDDPRWADPGFDDSAWPLLRSDMTWSSQGFPGMSHYGWYRFSVVIPADSRPVAIQLGPILTTYQLYADGKLVGGFGNILPSVTPRAGWNFQDFPIPELPTRPADSSGQRSRSRTVHIAIRVWHSPIWSSYVGGGPQIGGNLLGDSKLIAAETFHHTSSRLLLFVDLYTYAVAALIISLTVFGLFLFRPQEREYLWFAVLLLAKAIDAGLSITKEIYAYPAIPIYDLLDSTMIAIAQSALLLFLTKVLKLRQGPLLKILLGMVIISPIFNIFYWPGWLSVPVSALLSVLFILPSSLWILITLAIGAIRRNPTARLLLVPILLVQGLYVADNITIAMVQFGTPMDARLFENPFITAPYTMHPSVLAELLFLLAMLAFLIRRFTVARRREERWEGALEAARQVQQVLLPEAIPEIAGFAIDCVYRPAEVVGGDFFQILPANDGGLLVVVGDVAGKGLAAAMMVSVLVGAIRTEIAHTSDPAAILTSLNERMFGRSQGFTTCLCMHLSAEGEITLVSAGHLSPYNNGVELNMPGALPLGIVSHARYERTTLTLAPGDRLTIVSDGVLEAQNRAGELLGFDRTKELSIRPATEIAQAANEFGQVDDITVVTIAFHGGATVILRDTIQVPVASS